MAFIDDAHRKRWDREQVTSKAKAAASRPGLANEYASAVRHMISGASSLTKAAAFVSGPVLDVLRQRMQGLGSQDAAERAASEQIGVSDVRRHVADLRKMAREALEYWEWAENALVDAELGVSGDELVLDVLATVPGLSLETDAVALADDDEDELEF